MSKQRTILFGGGAIGALLLVSHFMGWFSLEPTYQRRSVTEWLDRMALFEEFRRADETGQRTFAMDWSPGVVTNDSSLKALLSIGPKAVPALVEQAGPEPSWWAADMPWSDRVRMLWTELQSGSIGSPNLPQQWSSHVRARAQAAYLTLLAMGTNCGAGMQVALETYAESPYTTMGAVNRSFAFFDAVGVAALGLPDRKMEIASGIEAGLHHTNSVVRYASVNVVARFWNEQPNWNSLLLPLLEDSDESVAASATLVLAANNGSNPEILTMLGNKLGHGSSPPRVRASAATGLALAGEASARFLPILRETALSTDLSLRAESLREIKTIEKAIVAPQSDSREAPEENAK